MALLEIERIEHHEIENAHDLWDIFCASVFSALFWPKALYLYIKPNTSV